ncbi:MAG TPA: hypothetical protein VNZ47_01560 [Candidatus Dormibacteraeota bacterium]|jgi:hypothetical protein|nr:hypothetical protein [Candidatus Dormibacteraeota bacterium]
MKHRLLTFDYVFWYAIILCQVVACRAVIKRQEFFKRWKVFSYYLFYMAGASIFTIAAFTFGSRELYVVTYSVFDFIEAILLNLVLLEILVKVLDPFESLPGRTVAKFCFWAVLGISTAVAFSVMMPSGHKMPLVEVPLTIERTIFLADAALLWILLVQAKKLGITWKSSVAEIAIGFVLYLTVQATTRFVASIYTDPALRSISSEVGQAGYLIALLGWIWTITHRDPVDAPLSSEAVARIQKPHSEDESVTKERIFAAVGIKVNRPEENADLETAPEEECGQQP